MMFLMPTEPSDQQVPRPQEVFISYSRKDTDFVRRLDEELKRRNREAWVDWEGIPPGDTWEKTIYGAIEATNTFIFVLTPDSIDLRFAERKSRMQRRIINASCRSSIAMWPPTGYRNRSES